MHMRVPDTKAALQQFKQLTSTYPPPEVHVRTSVRVRQDEIRPHDIGIRAACARIDYDRMQVVACTNLMGTDGVKKALLRPQGSPFHTPGLGHRSAGTIIQ